MATSRRFLLLDNGGETADRFTLYDTKPMKHGYFGTTVLYIGFSENPYHPQGFGQHGETTVSQLRELKQELRNKGSSNIGKVAKLKDLPEKAQKFAKSFMDSQLKDHP